MWIRASLAGFTFARHPKPLGWYTCRPDSLSSSDTRMLSGILRVFAKTRPSLPAASPERAILDQQVARFEMELLAAEARDSLIARRCARRPREHLAALHARRGGWVCASAPPPPRSRHGWRWRRIACVRRFVARRVRKDPARRRQVARSRSEPPAWPPIHTRRGGRVLLDPPALAR